jgi:predicted enzyme related to lactoylglutathione lyase
MRTAEHRPTGSVRIPCTLAIGTLRCFVIDVEDLEVGTAFWSEVTGLPRISSVWPDRFAYLGYQDDKTWKHEIILHRVPTAKRSDSGAVNAARRLDPAANRAHIDITVEDVDAAIVQIEAIGGRLKYPPTVYPVPHAYEGARPLIDWAVLQDPFGNEFCLVRELTRPEREALAVAAEQGPAEDAHWRAVARDARRAG